MLENSTIARPYATAVFELAQETGRVQEWSATLELLGMLAADSAMRQLMTNPKVSRDQLRDLVFDVCGDGLDGPGRNLARLLVQGDRLQYTQNIKTQYEQMRAAAEGKVDVEVVTPYSLDEQQQAGIAESISERLGKQVNIKTSVDEALIGGAVIRAGDSIIDASLRGRLSELHNELVRR
ncbi:MAG: F0F1 ATP synthase subunit delta [Gammaproteobacteria bacterium]|nr:F0F1 ATP synthase subunit delta [Gammaproteobacteria bacterium]MDE0284807.1 F0F1 ATP synthase subunit delta [Gammaproteobacteria bacterium]MDE0512694.1 F0F1 ATP synthase subunit delta [Gammaproteobacteria bacterium]